MPTNASPPDNTDPTPSNQTTDDEAEGIVQVGMLADLIGPLRTWLESHGLTLFRLPDEAQPLADDAPRLYAVGASDQLRTDYPTTAHQITLRNDQIGDR